MTPRQTRALIEKLGMKYVCRDRGSYVIRIAGERNPVVAIGDSQIEEWNSIAPQRHESIFHELADHSSKAAALNAAHLLSPHDVDRVEHGFSLYRTTLCGNRWLRGVTGVWSGFRVLEPRDGGCQHCRVLLDGALERDAVEVSVHIRWKADTTS